MMEKLISSLVLLLLFCFIFSGCDTPTDEQSQGNTDVWTAVSIALSSYGTCVSQASGPGFETVAGQVTFTDYDVSGLSGGIYSTMSGTVTPVGDIWTFDLTYPADLFQLCNSCLTLL